MNFIPYYVVLQRDISDIFQALENTINKIGQGFFLCIWIKDGKVTFPSKELLVQSQQ